MHNKQKKLFYAVVAVAVVFIIGIAVLGIGFFASYGMVYHTEDVAEYGQIKGNYENDEPNKYIFSFFPAEISADFSDVTYHYKAKKGDTYAYECYLEFVIEDCTKFDAFIADLADVDKAKAFAYDPNYKEISLDNIFDTYWKSPKTDGSYAISYAKIGKILYNDLEQRVVFFALGMYDGGGATTSELGCFFDRFEIDIEQYRLDAYYSDSDQLAGITCQERDEIGFEPFVLDKIN